MVLGTALLLVVAIARLLGGSSDGSDGADRAAQTAAGTTPDSVSSTTPSAAAPSTTSTTRPGGKRNNGGKGPKATEATSEAPVLAEPDGPCAGSDVAVTPEVTSAVAGRDVMVVLQLRTLKAEACTWQVGRNTLTVDITSGKDAIWSSRQCPRAIPQREVVVRRNLTTKVGVIWAQAKRSGDHCTVDTDWAMPGWYHVTAAALGGEPSDVQFQLTTPVAGTVTKTAKPSQSATPKG